MRARSRWIPALFFIALPVLPLWKAVFLGLCIGPFDQIRQMAPWHASPPAQPWDILQADGVLQFFPWRSLVLDSWSRLQPPYWNPYELAGTPLLANSQSAGFYPPHILLGILHFPAALAILVLAWAHLAWAGLGVYCVSRRLGGGRLPALIGGAGFVFTPFMLSWTALSSVITTVSWIPWCLLFVVEAFVPGGSVSPKFPLAPTAKLAVCAGMMLLAGHLQFSAYGFMAIFLTAIGMLCLGRKASPNPLGSALGVGIGLVLGFCLAAPQLLPVLTFSKTSNRQNQASEDGYKVYAASAIQPFEFANLSNPFALGNPRESVDDKNVSLSTYWPAVVKRGDNFAESAITIGPFLLGLLALVPWRKKTLLPIAVLGIFSLLLCSGSPLDQLLYFHLPGWSATGSPGRSCVLFLIAVCILAGSVETDPEPIGKERLGAAAGLIGFGIICSFLGPALSPAAPERAAQLVDLQRANGSLGSLTALLQGTAFAALGLALLCWSKLSKYRRLAAAIPILICLVSGGLSWVTSGTPNLTVGGPVGGARVAYINQDWPLLGGAQPNTPPNVSSVNQIHELGGYDSLLNGETVALLNRINGGDSAPLENGNMMFVKTENLDGLKEAGVSFIGTGSGLRPIPNAPGRVSFSGGPCSIVSEDLTQITLNLTGAGTVTLRDRLMPGWSASLDGTPIPIKPGVWRVVEVSGAGAHVLKFTYRPPGLHRGLLLCAVSLLIAVGFAVIGRRRAKDTPAASKIE